MQGVIQRVLKYISEETFIDYCVNEFSEHFPESSLTMFTGYKLHPGKVHQITTADINIIQRFYEGDLPSGATLGAEVEICKEKFAEADKVELDRMKLVDVLPLADMDFFPNIPTVLRILLTIPVGSVPCEHSFSSLRRLKDWSRPSMAENRLNGLALLYIHQDKFVHKMKVLRRFDSTGHRRLKL